MFWGKYFGLALFSSKTNTCIGLYLLNNLQLTKVLRPWKAVAQNKMTWIMAFTREMSVYKKENIQTKWKGCGSDLIFWHQGIVYVTQQHPAHSNLLGIVLSYNTITLNIWKCALRTKSSHTKHYISVQLETIAMHLTTLSLLVSSWCSFFKLGTLNRWLFTNKKFRLLYLKKVWGGTAVD